MSEPDLIYAAKIGDLEKVKYLLSKGISADSRQGVKSALLWSIYNNHPNISIVLVEHGADLDKDLMSSVEDGDFNTIIKLLSFGANVNHKDALGQTPLMHAVQKMSLWEPGVPGTTDMIELLLSKGAQIGIWDNNGKTVYDFITDKNPMRVKILEIINTHKDKLNNELIFSVQTGDYGMVKKFLSFGADPNYRFVSGKTPLMIAVERVLPWEPSFIGDPKMVELLLENGADINEFHYGKNIYDYIKYNNPIGPMIVKILAKYDNNLDEDLMAYANSIDPTVVKKISEYKNDLGENLMASTKNRKIPKIKHLLSLGANPNYQDISGQTPLMIAAQIVLPLGTRFIGDPEIVEILLENGAKLNIQDNNGKTMYDFIQHGSPMGAMIMTKIGKHRAIKIRNHLKKIKELRDNGSTYFSRIPKDLIDVIIGDIKMNFE